MSAKLAWVKKHSGSGSGENLNLKMEENLMDVLLLWDLWRGNVVKKGADGAVVCTWIKPCKTNLGSPGYLGLPSAYSQHFWAARVLTEPPLQDSTSGRKAEGSCFLQNTSKWGCSCGCTAGKAGIFHIPPPRGQLQGCWGVTCMVGWELAPFRSSFPLLCFV